MSSYFDEASLVMIPSGYKDQKLYAVKPLDGSGDLTFSRASSATRVASNGLIEKVRTNLALQSNTFSNASWTKTDISVTSGQAGYDGTNNAWLVANTANSGNLTQNISFSGFNTLSLYVKAGTHNYVFLLLNGGGFNATAVYNLSTGAITNTSGDALITTATSVGNGWWRITITGSRSNTDFRIYPSNTTGAATTNGNILVQNVQLEAGDIATAYIPTTSAAVSVGPVSGLPRLDYLNSTCPRLLLEPQRTNKITYSENQGPTGTNWYPSTTWTVTNNTVTSPDGYTDADTLTEDTSTGFHSSYFNATIDNSYTGTYTISAFAKYNGRLFVLSPKGSAQRTYFNLQTGTVAQAGTGVTASIVSYGNGWYRCICTATFASENVNFEHMLATAVGTLQYTGNGTSGVHIWGCMAEAGAYATSYIPTLGTSVTRVAESASSASVPSLFGATEGSFFIEMTFDGKNPNGAIPLFLRSSVSSSFNQATYLQFGASNINYNVYSGGTAQFALSGGSFTHGQNIKVAFAYKANDFALYVNGVQIGTYNSGAISASLSFIDLGSYLDLQSTFQYDGKISQAILFPTRLSNSDLAALTA
jgi:hypothetical protein